MDAKTLLFVGLGIVLGVYAVAIIRGGFAVPTVLQTAIGFVTAFFDTLGIGSFATTTAVYKLRRMVPVKLMPGTLNVGHALSTIAQAFVYTSIVPVDPTTLVLMIVAACIGSWLGAGVVVHWPRRKIQIGMGIALMGAAMLMLMTRLDLFPAGGARPRARRSAGGPDRRPDREVDVGHGGSMAGRGRRHLHVDQHADDGGPSRAGRAGGGGRTGWRRGEGECVSRSSSSPGPAV